MLSGRLASREKVKAALAGGRAAKRQELEDNPFDRRTEVSADAKRIVAHLWILFILLPIVVGLLLTILGVLK